MYINVFGAIDWMNGQVTLFHVAYYMVCNICTIWYFLHFTKPCEYMVFVVLIRLI